MFRHLVDKIDVGDSIQRASVTPDSVSSLPARSGRILNDLAIFICNRVSQDLIRNERGVLDIDMTLFRKEC
ncbi:hypothetical protein SS33_00330 [Enterobacter kobei]|nr:hypothetical protein SS33_00330 [Enterobacter kobei]